MQKFEKIMTIENPVEAQVIEAELKKRNIPHLIRSFHDTAYDGIFQLSLGWGQLEAPVEFKQKILSIADDIRT